MKKLISALLASIMLFSLSACASKNTEYPSETITIICPWAVGGGGDIVTRVLADLLAEELGTSVIVENITGSGGQVGTIQYMDYKPDGYTLLFCSDVLLYLAPRVMEVDYDPDALHTITTLITNGYGIIVNPNTGITDLASLKAYGDENGTLTCGVMGLSGAINYEIMNALFTQMDIDVEFIVFGSAAEVATEVLGGHIDLGIAVNPICDQFLQDGSLNYIASFLDGGYVVEGCERIPSTTEQGYDVITANPNILCINADTPDEYIELLTQAMINVSSDLDAKLTELNYNPYILFGDELSNYLAELDQVYAEMADAQQ